jgi:hypothetical protein
MLFRSGRGVAAQIGTFRAWLRPRAWLLDLATVFSLIAIMPFLLRPYLYDALPCLRYVGGAGFVWDEGTVLHHADRLGRGDAMYLEFFDFKGPIGYLPFAVAFNAFSQSITNGRIAMFLVLGVLAAAMYLAVRGITRNRPAAWMFAALIPFFAWPSWPFAYQDLVSATFVVGGVGLATVNRPAFVVGAGALLGLSLWTTISQGIPAALALGITLGLRSFIVGRGRDVVPTVIRFVAGGAAVSAVVCVWFALKGALSKMTWCIFAFPFKHYMAPSNIVPYAHDRPKYIDAWSKHDALDGHGR